MGRGGNRIVCAAVAKSEMIFKFIRNKNVRGKEKKPKKKQVGIEREVKQVSSLHSCPPYPPSPSSEGLGSSGGGATKSDKN